MKRSSDTENDKGEHLDICDKRRRYNAAVMGEYKSFLRHFKQQTIENNNL